VKFYYHDGVKETRNGPATSYLVVLHEGEWKRSNMAKSIRLATAPKLKPFRMPLPLRAGLRKEGQDADVLIQEEDLRSGHPFYRPVRAPGRAS